MQGLFGAYSASDGNDANLGPLLQSCRLLPATLNAIADAGESWMLDSASYGSNIGITKPVTILVVVGTLGSVTNNGRASFGLMIRSCQYPPRPNVIDSLSRSPPTVVAAPLRGAAGFEPRIAVIIPCYRVARSVLEVLSRIGPECWRIYVVDDACPENSGDVVAAACKDPRVHVLRHAANQGVGGAVITGYRSALADGATVIVKIDGDGQMAPELLPAFVAPIIAEQADYAKGNRFYDLAQIRRMPGVRLFGNAALSFLAKLSTGYWDLFDPTNGYTAIHASVLARLPLDKISRRYFFETDMLFRLNTIRASVVDVPMDSTYGNEVSNLRISRVLGEFLIKHLRNAAKRVFYNYFLRDFTVASLELVFGLILLAFGVTFGMLRWSESAHAGMATSAGTVMLSALPILTGLQFLLAFIGFDIASTPRRPIHPALSCSAPVGLAGPAPGLPCD